MKNNRPPHTPPTAGISRRDMLKLVGASAVTLAASGCAETDNTPTVTTAAAGVGSNTAPSSTASTERLFRHGVASGEPLPDAVVIWTRPTPSDDAVPGSGLGADVPLVWDVAADAFFTQIVKTGSVVATSAQDHTVHVDVTGLQPGRYYWYRFKAGEVISQTGRTRTAPAAASSPDALRFGIVTCAEYEFGHFGAYRLLAGRNDIEAIIHMGDYIYEFGNGYGPIATPGAQLGRVHQPGTEITTLKDYRIRYGQYRSDPNLRLLHAAHPFITIYDDHEIANDWWREGAENHTEGAEGTFVNRLSGGLQAWREWQPLRQFSASDVRQAWRQMKFGDLLDLWLIDTRLYRDKQPTNAIVGYGSVDPAVDDPARTILGTAQKTWLKSGLQASTARWKVLGNQVPFYPFAVGPSLPGALAPLATAGAGTLPPLPATLTVEDWNGYRAEQREMIGVMSMLNNVVVLTGDYHESFAAEIPSSTGDYLSDGNSVGVEFICPAVTSPGLSETLGRAGLPASQAIDAAFEANLRTSNPWVKYHEGFSNGFAVIEFAREKTQYDYWFIADRTNPQTTGRVAASWEVRNGAGKLFQSTAALPARTLT